MDGSTTSTWFCGDLDANNDNEASGRGLIARRSINDGDCLLDIPLSLCLTRRKRGAYLGTM